MMKAGKRFFSIVLSVVSAIMVLASNPVNVNATTSELKLDTSSYTFQAVEKSYIVLAKMPADRSKKVLCSSNNSQIAIVQPLYQNAKGCYFKITSKGIGTTKINISVGGNSSSLMVTVPSPKAVKTYGKNEPFYFKDSAGYNLYSLTVTDAVVVKETENSKQLILINYTYTNIAKKEFLNISGNHFVVEDSKGSIGRSGFSTIEMLDSGIYSKSDDAAVGESRNARALVEIDNKSDQITVKFLSDLNGQIDAAFLLNI